MENRPQYRQTCLLVPDRTSPGRESRLRPRVSGSDWMFHAPVLYRTALPMKRHRFQASSAAGTKKLWVCLPLRSNRSVLILCSGSCSVVYCSAVMALYASCVIFSSTVYCTSCLRHLLCFEGHTPSLDVLACPPRPKCFVDTHDQQPSYTWSKRHQPTSS